MRGTALGGPGVKASAGMALTNGLPTIASWTAPNDGQLHPFVICATLIVSSLETGGAVGFTAGAAASAQLFAGGKAAGTYQGPDAAGATSLSQGVLGPGQTVTVKQTSALTGGAASVFVVILGS